MKQERKEAFSPSDKCCVCGADYNEEEGGIQGYFGIMPVTFCCWCLSSTVDMVEQLNNYEGEDNECIEGNN